MSDRSLLGYFARHPLAANLVMALVIFLGLWFTPQLKNTLTPDIHFPALELTLEWPGAGAEAITTEVIEPVESRLMQVPGVQSTMSYGTLGMATVNLVLATNVDPGDVKQDVLNAIDGLQHLPAGLRPPRIRTVAFDERALRLGLAGGSKEALYQEALEIRRALLERGVPKIEIDGWTEPQLEISIAGNELRALDMSLPAIADQVRAQLGTQIAGNLLRDGDDLIISRSARTLDEHSLASLMISNTSGRPFQLGDVARIGWRTGDRQIARVDGQDGIVLTLFRSLDNDTLAVSRITRDWLERYRAQRPNSSVRVLEDASGTVRANRDMLIGNAISGLVIVFVSLWLVLGWRSAFWTAAGIPVIVFATLLVLLATGQTINMFTVAGFIMVLGVLVDDAIVIAEDCDTLDPASCAGELPSLVAARRMAGPVLAAGLTTLAAFVPLLFLPGLLGATVVPIAIVVVVAISASLLECFFILPAHLRRPAGAQVVRPAQPPIGDRWLAALQHAVQPAMRAAVERRGLTLKLTAIGIVLAMATAVWVFNSDETEVDNDTLRTIVYLEPTTPRSERLAIIEQLEASLRAATDALHAAPQVIRSWSVVERQTLGNPWLESVVSLVPSTERDFSSAELMRQWGERLQPNSWVRHYGMETSADKPSTSITWTLSGRVTLQQLQAATEEFRQRLSALPEVLQVEDNFSQGAQRLDFDLKPQGRALGLDEAAVAGQLYAGFEGIAVGQIEHAGAQAEVRVKLPIDERRPDRVAQFPVQTALGSSVPLWSVATLRQQPATSTLGRVDGQPQAKVTAHLRLDRMAERGRVKAEVDAGILSDIERRYDLKRGITPLERDRAALLTAMTTAFFVSCVGIYLIMAWSTRSLLWPLLIVAVIPLGIAGAVFAHLLTGVSFGIFSLFGLLGMVGVVVNDAIVYLARYREIRDTLPPREAALGAANDRFRAIALTTLTTVLGTLPLLFDDSANAALFKPMLVSFSGGLVAGTVLLLLVLPSLLSWVEERRVRPAASSSIASGALALEPERSN